MYPVTDIDLPGAFNQLIKPKKILSLNPNLIHTSKKDWVDEWLNSQ
jgi:ABC-type thiamine transport system substrate-binding protein